MPTNTRESGLEALIVDHRHPIRLKDTSLKGCYTVNSAQLVTTNRRICPKSKIIEKLGGIYYISYVDKYS